MTEDGPKQLTSPVFHTTNFRPAVRYLHLLCSVIITITTTTTWMIWLNWVFSPSSTEAKESPVRHSRGRLAGMGRTAMFLFYHHYKVSSNAGPQTCKWNRSLTFCSSSPFSICLFSSPSRTCRELLWVGAASCCFHQLQDQMHTKGRRRYTAHWGSVCCFVPSPALAALLITRS